MIGRRKRKKDGSLFLPSNSPDFTSVEIEFALSLSKAAAQAALLLNGKELEYCALDTKRGAFTVGSCGHHVTIATPHTDAARNILSMIAIGPTKMRSYEEGGKIVVIASCGDWMYRVRGVVSATIQVQ